jgi:hypothetical protein
MNFFILDVILALELYRDAVAVYSRRAALVYEKPSYLVSCIYLYVLVRTNQGIMYWHVLVCTGTYRYIRFCPILSQSRCIGFQMIGFARSVCRASLTRACCTLRAPGHSPPEPHVVPPSLPPLPVTRRRRRFAPLLGTPPSWSSSFPDGSLCLHGPRPPSSTMLSSLAVRRFSRLSRRGFCPSRGPTRTRAGPLSEPSSESSHPRSPWVWSRRSAQSPRPAFSHGLQY